jgi:hypothetical protein
MQVLNLTPKNGNLCTFFVPATQEKAVLAKLQAQTWHYGKVSEMATLGVDNNILVAWCDEANEYGEATLRFYSADDEGTLFSTFAPYLVAITV